MNNIIYFSKQKYEASLFDDEEAQHPRDLEESWLHLTYSKILAHTPSSSFLFPVPSLVFLLDLEPRSWLVWLSLHVPALACSLPSVFGDENSPRLERQMAHLPPCLAELLLFIRGAKQTL